jgi:hypothetical protein
MPKTADPIVPVERAAASFMGRELVPTAEPLEAPPPVQPQIPMAVSTAVPIPSLLKRKHKEILVSWSLKLPLSLKTELENVARFNEIPMSEIVIEALRRHLPDYEHPPEGWRQGRRK